VAGDAESARSNLQSAFDVLNEAREYIHPVEAHLLDLTLVAPSTMGASLRAELARPVPTNLLLTGETLEAMAREEPESLRAVIEALANKTATIIGGHWRESEMTLLPPEAIALEIRRGLAAFERHLGVRPTVFARRRFGLSPAVPQILSQLGFEGCLHFTLDDGRFPTGNQSRIRWGGPDGTTIEALARVPVDAASAETFLRLPEKLGDAMDLDHVPTVVFAHWAGQASPWYAEIQRITRFSPVLGQFESMAEYLKQTSAMGQTAQYPADQYRSPYLRQDVSAGRRDPISRHVRYFRRRACWEAQQSLRLLAALVRGQNDGPDQDDRPDLAGQLDLARQIQDALEDPNDAAALDGQLEAALTGALGRFAECLGRGPSGPLGTLEVNPWPSSRRVFRPRPVRRGSPGARQESGEEAVPAESVEVPGFGFAWIGPETEPSKASTGRLGFWRRARKPPPPLAEGTTLRNEHFEVYIDPHTGAIRAVVDFAGGGNRVAQQIALRLPEPNFADEDFYGSTPQEYWYSVMAADQIAVTEAGPDYGQIECRGRLCDRQGQRLAGFVQRTRLTRGSRILDIEIELEPDTQPEPDPWKSYYAARFAWDDETAELWRGAGMTARPAQSVAVEAPQFVEIRSGRARTAILTGGLPYHRKHGLRMLDTLLVVHGETARKFRLAVGLDLPHPMMSAMRFLAPPTALAGSPAPIANAGWLLHLDARNVAAGDWEPLVEQGGVVGFRVRLLETEGRRAALGLRSFRPVKKARKLGARDPAAAELPIAEDRVKIEIGPYEWTQIECRFEE